MHESIAFLVRVQYRRKEIKFTFAISSPDKFLVHLGETPEPFLKQEATSHQEKEAERKRGGEWNKSLVPQLTNCGCTYVTWQTIDSCLQRHY